MSGWHDLLVISVGHLEKFVQLCEAAGRPEREKCMKTIKDEISAMYESKIWTWV